MMTGASLYVAHINPTGKVISAKGFGSAATFFPMRNVAASGSGEALLVGSFNGGTVDFGGPEITSMMSEDVFMAKLDPAAAHVWTKRFGDADNQRATGVAVDALGHIAVVGTFTGKLDFDMPLQTVMSAGDNIFVTKLDGAGKGIWSKQFGTMDVQYGKEVAMDPLGGVALAGTFKGGVSFGGPVLQTEGQTDIYVAKLAP
jgi:hypothetical protein